MLAHLMYGNIGLLHVLPVCYQTYVNISPYTIEAWPLVPKTIEPQ